MTSSSSRTSLSLIVFSYAVVYIVWGSTFFFIEKALHVFPPFVIGSVRFMTAGSLLMGFCWLKGYKLFERQQIKEAAFVGFLLLFLDMAAIIWSEQYISSGIVSIISAATVIWFIVLDKPKWKVNFSSITTVLGLVMGFGGVLLLFAEQAFQASESDDDQSMVLIAMIVMTLGTIAWTVGSLLTKYNKERQLAEIKKQKKKGEKPKELHVMVKTAWQMLIAGVAFTIVGSTNGDYARFQPADVSAPYWGAMAYLILMGSILAFSCYIWLLQVRPATEVSTFAYVNPIVALLLVHFFTDHQVTSLQITGLVIVLLSVFLMNWKLYRNNKIFVNYKRRRKIKKVRDMAPRSSIPRIIEVFEFIKNKNRNSQKGQKDS